MKYFLIALLTASLAGAAVAGGHGHKGKDDASHMEKMSKQLALNAEQAAAIKQLHEKYRADKQALRKQHYQEISKILNAEQMEKYLDMKEEMKEKHHYRKDKKYDDS